MKKQGIHQDTKSNRAEILDSEARRVYCAISSLLKSEQIKSPTGNDLVAYYKSRRFSMKAPPKPVKPELSSKPDLTNFVSPFRSSKRRKIMEGEALWREKIDRIDKDFTKAQAKYERAYSNWQKKKTIFESESQRNLKRLKKLFSNNDSYGTEDLEFLVCLALRNSKYPFDFEKSIATQCLTDDTVVVVNYQMPRPDVLPKEKGYKYIKSRDEIQKISLTRKESEDLFDKFIYQVCLRSIHEIFSITRETRLETIVFNGWVKDRNKATGKMENTCILSISVSREEFRGIDLRHVDPPYCFRKLKGVASSKLSGIAPVAPIANVSRDDERFIQDRAVASGLSEGQNIAAMDWQEFEHLIRELFQKEFSEVNGEVKVTRASRDGGVDAIAFDPDPIRGGKIVIQAKRYTNPVDVASVRDLYGTVVNEGAMKGILVTTSTFGPDAYKFAQGKPVSLVDGGNLLHLLMRHGHKAHIDLKEAKLLLREE